MVEKFGTSDFLISGIITILLYWYLRYCFKKGDFDGLPNWFVPTLVAVHFIISGISCLYILRFGGDSISYWRLTADTSQNANEWVEYWGRNTFFLQWLNYLPSKILDLNYLTGCLIYSCLGVLGFVWLVILAKPFYLKVSNLSDSFSLFFSLVFFLPGAHFWTGIVGKEALIWFFLVLGIRGIIVKNYFHFVLSIGVLIWIRPLLGFIFTGVFIVYLACCSSISYRRRLGLLIFLSVAGILSIGSLYHIVHFDDLSFKSLNEFSEGQYSFLRNFEPKTLVSMEEYSNFFKLFTVGFRPLIGEVDSFWGFFAGLENSIFLILFLGLFPLIFYSTREIKIFILLVVFIAGLVFYLLSIAVSVNVMGIMIRLKSSVFPIMAILGWYGWFLIFHQRKISRIF